MLPLAFNPKFIEYARLFLEDVKGILPLILRRFPVYILNVTFYKSKLNNDLLRLWGLSFPSNFHFHFHCFELFFSIRP